MVLLTEANKLTFPKSNVAVISEKPIHFLFIKTLNNINPNSKLCSGVATDIFTTKKVIQIK
jgi:hypothetical protein